MSTSTSTPQQTPASAGAAAPWRSEFLAHVSRMESPEFSLATLLAPAAAESSTAAYVPRVRTCVFRGLWCELPENRHNLAPRNEERVFESDLLTFTTDVRMSKVKEIFASSRAQSHGHGHGGGEKHPEQYRGSGGGGPVEAVFWVKDAMTQWRISGTAFVVASDIEVAEGEEGEGESSGGVRMVKREIGERMRLLKEESKGGWSWERELTAHFGNLSPGMRGSFANPPPGTPVSLPLEDESLKLGQKVDDLHHRIARENFRVVIIKPDEVEQVDLTDPDRARRWRYTYVGPGKSSPGKAEQLGELLWKKEELWP